MGYNVIGVYRLILTNVSFKGDETMHYYRVLVFKLVRMLNIVNCTIVGNNSMYSVDIECGMWI